MRVLFFSLVLMVLALPPLVLAPGAGMAQEVSDAPISVDEILKALPFDPDDIDPASIDLEALKQGLASPDRVPEELLDQVFALEEAGRMNAAVRLLLPLVAEGNSDALAELGFFLLYRFDEQSFKDIALKVLWQASGGIDLQAMFYLGEAYAFGYEVKRHEKTGRILLESAAQLGNHDAAFTLGILFIRRDRLTAIKWFEQSASTGDIESKYALYLLSAPLSARDLSFAETLCLDFWAKLLGQKALDCQRFRR